MYISTNPHQPCDDFFVNLPLLLLPTHRTPRRIFWATPAGKLAAENKSADKSFEKKNICFKEVVKFTKSLSKKKRKKPVLLLFLKPRKTEESTDFERPKVVTHVSVPYHPHAEMSCRHSFTNGKCLLRPRRHAWRKNKGAWWL